jgi:hypothetical protein
MCSGAALSAVAALFVFRGFMHLVDMDNLRVHRGKLVQHAQRVMCYFQNHSIR